MTNRLRVSLVLLATVIAGVIIWRWEALGFAPLVAITGVLVVVGIPIFLIILPRIPRQEHRRLPAIFWVGLLLIGFGLSLILQGGSPTISGYTVSSGNPGNRLHLVSAPAGALRAVSRAFSQLFIRKAWQASTNPRTTVLFLSYRLHPNQYALDCIWDGKNLDFMNLAWNTRFGPFTQHASHPMPWSRWRPHIDVSSSAVALGPYRFPGYYLWVLPNRGTIYAVNAYTGSISGEGL